MISFLIPAYNEEKYVGTCVDAIFEHGGSLVGQVIVVNNASTDGTARVLAELQRRHGNKLVVVEEKMKGISFARQRGLREATEEYVASVDADCRPDARWFRRAKELMEKHPDAVCLTGPYEFYDPSPFVRMLVKIRKFIRRIPGANVQNPSNVFGGNFIAKRKDLVEAGGFNTSIQFYGEDIDVELRLKKRGKVIHDRSFYMLSSARRFNQAGPIRVWLTYTFARAYQLVAKKPMALKEQHDWR